MLDILLVKTVMVRFLLHIKPLLIKVTITVWDPFGNFSWDRYTLLFTENAKK